MRIADKLTAVAENVPKVYAAGKQAATEEFWTGYQPLDQYNMGDLWDCSYLFAGPGWTDENFNPDIIPKNTIANAYMMFAKNRVTDLRMLPPLAVHIHQYMFTNNTSIRHVGQIEVTHPTIAVYGVFNRCTALETVEKFTVNEGNVFTAVFDGAVNLSQIRFGGVIGSAISFADCSKLSNDSVQSVIDCLKDLTGATAQTLTFHATVGAALTEEQKAAIAAKNWIIES